MGAKQRWVETGVDAAAFHNIVYAVAADRPLADAAPAIDGAKYRSTGDACADQPGRANGHKLTLTNFRIVISDHPGLTAVVNRDPSMRVRILNLDLNHAAIDMHPPMVTVANVKATLTQTAASALNSALGVSFFAKGITLGTAKVTAHIG